LVIDLEEAAHAMLVNEARIRGLTLSNYVRGALNLPLERQGLRPDATVFASPTIEDVPEFYLVHSRASYQVWIPGVGGQPHQVLPAPRLLKAGYAGPESVRSGQLQYAESTLRGEYPILLLPVPHSFGSPLPNASELWEIISTEPDPADRCIFILSPVKLPHGLPTPDFSKITDAAVRAEAQLHWKNLEQAIVAHNPYAIVNSAASLSEALLHAFLRPPSNTKQNLGEMLETLRNELDKKTSAFSVLSYHFMQAVRIMHQSTQHPGRVVANGRPVRPGLALTITEGMIEVLTSLSIVQ